jgi:putative tryptophan/tyrosine transport system substrate-binding protein
LRRRTFITLLGGTAAAWPLAARAQRQERMRRVAALMAWTESDPGYRSWFNIFVQRLSQLGWANGQNVRIDQRWANGEVDRIKSFAKELVELQPDVIFACTTPVTAALHRETHTIPIVFALVGDPVGEGFVASLARPGGNVTGFINVEAGMVSKLLQLLKEIAPPIKRAAIMFNPDTAPGGGDYYQGSFEAAARTLAVEPGTLRVRNDREIDTAITLLGDQQAGLVLMPDAFIAAHLPAIISSAARNNVPAIFDLPQYAQSGGLVSYGADNADMLRRAAGYVDRVLKGEKPADLPVQVPTKYELIINLKTARALGLEVPPTLLARADEVIE